MIAGFQELVAQQTMPGIMGQITAARKARIGAVAANWEWNSPDYWMTALRTWRRTARTIACSGQRAESSRGVLDGQFSHPAVHPGRSSAYCCGRVASSP